MLKVSQVADRLSVGHQTVLDWIRKGIKNHRGVKKLTATKAGGGYRVTESDLEKFLEKIEADYEPPKKTKITRDLQQKIEKEIELFDRIFGK